MVKKKTSSFRARIKDELRQRLLYAGFTCNGNDRYEKRWNCGSRELNYALYNTYFEVEEIEHPLKEGWAFTKYKYTQENIEQHPASLAGQSSAQFHYGLAVDKWSVEYDTEKQKQRELRNERIEEVRASIDKEVLQAMKEWEKQHPFLLKRPEKKKRKYTKKGKAT